MIGVQLTKTSVETLGSKAFGRGFGIGGSICSVCTKGRDESATIRKPETTERAKDTSWETVAENPFENTTDNHEKAAHKHVHGAVDVVRFFH